MNTLEKRLINLLDIDLVNLTANMVRNLNTMDKKNQPHYDDYKARVVMVSNLFIKRFGERAFESLLDRI